MEYYLPYLTQGSHEPPVLDHVTRIVNECPNPRVLDIGAHYGWYTICLAKLIGTRGTVFAFEPSEKTFMHLRRNVQVNSLENVRLYKTPLSDGRESVYMTRSRRFLGERREMVPSDQTSVFIDHDEITTTVPFDEINDAESIHPNIVMIDVHGVYRKVFDGMTECLKRDVQYLFIELFNPKRDLLYGQYEDIEHIISKLRSMDFTVFEITNYLEKGDNTFVAADVDIIAKTGNSCAMIYACKA
jgi:FkbM family methyltransferase